MNELNGSENNSISPHSCLICFSRYRRISKRWVQRSNDWSNSKECRTIQPEGSEVSRGEGCYNSTRCTTEPVTKRFTPFGIKTVLFSSDKFSLFYTLEAQNKDWTLLTKDTYVTNDWKAKRLLRAFAHFFHVMPNCPLFAVPCDVASSSDDSIHQVQSRIVVQIQQRGVWSW